MTALSNAPSPEALGFSSQRLARIKPALQAYVDSGKFAGISTLLARRGQIVHFQQVGTRDKVTQAPMSADTIFRIYSMTKPVVCTALMTLYEECRFHLFDPLAKFIPAFAKVKVWGGDDKSLVDPVRPILIRDLFTHTAGLTYGFMEDSPVGAMYHEAALGSNAERPLEAVVKELTRMPLAYQPGSKWHYSMSIDVLGHLIEVISGQPLQDFLKKRVFDPLGMADTGFLVPETSRSRIAAMYGHPDIMSNRLGAILSAAEAGLNLPIDVSTTYPTGCATFARGGHGLFSTSRDFLRFAQMLLNRGELDGERILGPKITDLMHTNHLPAHLLPFNIGVIPFPGYGFGLGSRVLMNVAESALPGSAGEFGWSGAAATYYWVDPKEELIGILMTQYMVSLDLIQKDFQLLAYQALVG